MLIEESDRQDPGAFQQKFTQQYGLVRGLEFVYKVYVTACRAFHTVYNTSGHYHPSYRHPVEQPAAKRQRR